MKLSGRFGYFLYFSVLGRGQGGGVRGGGGGGAVLIKNRGRGGGSEEEARAGEWRRGNICGEGGGGAKYFFFGAETPTKESCLFTARLCRGSHAKFSPPMSLQSPFEIL